MPGPELRAIEPGHGRVVLLVVAHADDMTLFVGGTVAAWTREGWSVVVVRTTDDRWDSVGLDEQATIERNTVQFHEAARILGVTEVVDLGYPTDTLGDVSEVALREQIIRQVRTHRPYALVTFDPYSMFGEDNQDHVQVAAATDESFWTSQFDKHHPEHLEAGLAVHGCFERWYFGRELQRVTDVIDISDSLDRKIEAASAQSTMMLHLLHQLRLQAATGGWRIDAIEDALALADPSELIGVLLHANAERVGSRYGVGAAEEFRVVRFGGLAGWLDDHGTRVT